MNIRKAKKLVKCGQFNLKVCKCSSVRVQKDLRDLFGDLGARTEWWCLCGPYGVQCYYLVSLDSLDTIRNDEKVVFLRQYESSGGYELASQSDVEYEGLEYNKNKEYYWAGPGATVGWTENCFLRPCSQIEAEWLRSMEKEYDYVGKNKWIAVWKY